MTKILLINPKFSAFNVDPNADIESLPIGLMCIGSFLVSKGFTVKLVDCLATTNYLEVVQKELESCFCVGISVMTSQVSEALKISQLVKEKEPNIPVVWGGAHPTLFPEETAIHPLIDYVVKDEGELTFLELIEALQNNSDRRNIQGIAYSNNGNVINNERRKFMNMDDLPQINWDLLDEGMLNRIKEVPAHTSRGCPHRCTFCINCVTRNYWRGRSPEKVLDELKSIRVRFGDTCIRFWDENFFVNKARATKTVEGIYEGGLNIRWETTVRADYFNSNYINEDFLFKLERAGCYKLSFGAESGSQRILDMLWKDISVKQLVDSAALCKKADIIPEYSFMIGLPGETPQDVEMTINLIDELHRTNRKAEFLGPQPFRPYPGGPLYEQCLSYGWKSPTSLQEWAKFTEEERSYLSPKNFPWVSDPDYVEALGPYLNYALKDIKRLLSRGVNVNKFFKLLFILAAKLRWRFKYFKHPIEYKIARYVV